MSDNFDYSKCLKSKQKKWLAAVLILLSTGIVMYLVAWWNPLERCNWIFPMVLPSQRNQASNCNIEIDQNTLNAIGLALQNGAAHTTFQLFKNVKNINQLHRSFDLNFKSPKPRVCQTDLEQILKADNPGRNFKGLFKWFGHPNDIALGNELKKYNKLS